MILPIINKDISVGDIYSGLINGALLEITDIKEKGIYYGPNGRVANRKETLVMVKDRKTGRVFETNLITAQTLLIERVSENG